MQVIITAVGPDNVGLADPIIHDVTGRGANIAEIQMYDHDDNEPRCLAEGVRRVVAGEVQLHFHRVVATGG